ncbi:Hypothetical predicted protein [Olea europaea subsp. europaea]|uniref:Uncharacterized protein n=1 Tax=Olea europaea subsp. europaea TaxID=158383 RepID=A0A8S0TUA9_OLEEU|nr:Hypothetical predicted protein [Olea europaea subsp. europaea]
MASSQVEFATSLPLRLLAVYSGGFTAAGIDAPPLPSRRISMTWLVPWQTVPSNVTASPDNIVITRNGNDDNNKNNENDRGKIKASDKDKWARAREMVFAGDRKNQGRVSSGSCSIFKRRILQRNLKLLLRLLICVVSLPWFRNGEISRLRPSARRVIHPFVAPGAIRAPRLQRTLHEPVISMFVNLSLIRKHLGIGNRIEWH